MSTLPKHTIVALCTLAFCFFTCASQAKQQEQDLKQNPTTNTSVAPQSTSAAAPSSVTPPAPPGNLITTHPQWAEWTKKSMELARPDLRQEDAIKLFNALFDERTKLQATFGPITSHPLYVVLKSALNIRFTNITPERRYMDCLALWEFSHQGTSYKSKRYRGLYHGGDGYEADKKAALVYNDILVAAGDEDAIKRKIEGLLGGYYGYIQNAEEARKFIEHYASKGNAFAQESKFYCLLDGEYSYEKSKLAARKFNDTLVKEGNPEAMERKIDGLTYGIYGYEEDRKEAQNLKQAILKRKIEGLRLGSSNDAQKALHDSIEKSATKGDALELMKKCEGHAYGKDGYKKDRHAAWEHNELLVKARNEKAIERKINGLMSVTDFTQPPMVEHAKVAVTYNELLIKQGNAEAIARKIEGLKYGHYGYEKDEKALHDFIEESAPKGNEKAIEGKINGLTYGYYGYEQDKKAAREFIEDLAKEGNETVLMHRVDGLWWGCYGYTKNQEASMKFLETITAFESPVSSRLKKKALDKYCGNLPNKGDRRHIEAQASKGDLVAIEMKIQGMECRTKGYDFFRKEGDFVKYIEELLHSKSKQF